MTIEVNGKIIETDNEGYIVNPDDWNEAVAEKLIKRHEADGHKPATETGRELINFFHEYYEAHQTHPSMHKCHLGCILVLHIQSSLQITPINKV